ncbi:MerR family transcriptional regulator [Alteromonas stellipolaris]|uniref:MerR family transcriptional regulator n=1 Tax=Alteromonas stellipolaris TaxID=233316 RepID=UPI001D31E355|nr:MerR family transcriptional regulator [Alteromonas stellipolaris]MBZ2163305.1 MerR family transcriptional regulator [Alteromonas stellipolaris]
MKILQLEKKSGLPRDTIRYYEDIGLLPAPNRSANGYRIYTKEHLTILRFILQGKAIGFSLKEIKSGLERYLELGRLCPEFKRELEAKKHFFSQRIKDDKAVVTHIDKMLKTS